MPTSFWRRHKQKIISAAILGAAGAAAAYHWWYSSREEEDDTYRDHQQQQQQRYGYIPRWPGPHADPPGPSLVGEAPPEAALGAVPTASDAATHSGDTAGPGEEGHQDHQGALDNSLGTHFAALQDLGDRAALEELLPRLKGVLYQATDYEPLKEALRNPAAALDAAGKAAAWRQLAGVCFTRAVAGAWLVPLLDLLVRAKLHLVGRHMYLESKLPALAPPSGRGLGAARLAMPPRLSDRAKEEFFRSDYFVEVGALGLVHKVRRAVEAALAGVDLAAPVGPGEVEALLGAASGAFQAAFVRCEDAWEGYLVPPGSQPLSTRTATGVAGFMSPIQASMVDELNNELREVIADRRWGEALRAAVHATHRATIAYVAERMASAAAAPGGGTARRARGVSAPSGALGGGATPAAAAAGGGKDAAAAAAAANGGAGGGDVAAAAAAAADRSGGSDHATATAAGQGQQQGQEARQQAVGSSTAGPGGETGTGTSDSPSPSSSSSPVKAAGWQQGQHRGGVASDSGSGRGASPPPAAAVAAGAAAGVGGGGEVPPLLLPRRPFPYVVPLVAKSCGVFFEEPERCTRGISGLREVQALCASIFTFGPHIC